MKKIKEFMRSPASTTVLFLLAALLLLGSTIGTAYAALTYFSEYYTSRVELNHVGVTLVENGSDLPEGTDDDKAVILEDLLGDDKSVAPGKKYSDKITVKNSGTIDGFFRVVVYRYWVDQETQEKRRDLEPGYIELSVPNLGNGWILDESASTPERLVYYYDKLLVAGDETETLIDGVTISGEITKFVTEDRTTVGDETTGILTTITRTYLYNGVEFRIELEADAVQNHNAQEAIKSAWGTSVTVDGSSLSLAKEG